MATRAEHAFSECTVAEGGSQLLLLSIRLPELGLVGYRGVIDGEHDQAWHRAEFTRQLQDPEHIEDLFRQKQASAIRLQLAIDEEMKRRQAWLDGEAAI